VVELLIENGAEVNARDNEKGGGSTPLVLACGPWIKTPEASKLETMQLLLSRGADPAAGKADDVMAKHFACMRGLQADGTRHKFAHPESPFRWVAAYFSILAPTTDLLPSLPGVHILRVRSYCDC
jgi:hypothetical protein